MHYEKINLKHVRLIEQLNILPTPGVNLIYGKNGSGKTSILEAIHLLSRAKSFRTPKINEIIKNGQTQLIVVGTVEHEHQGIVSLGFSREDNTSKLRYCSAPVHSISKQAATIPVVTQTTETHTLLIGGPKVRRKWLDWFMFHVEPDYLASWKKYHSAMRNRNLLLRQTQNDKQLDIWEYQMAVYGLEIIDISQSIIEILEKTFANNAQQLLGLNTTISYVTPIESMEQYQELLKQSRHKDRERGFTLYGPHRANIEFFVDEQKASKYLSRGQSKLYISALKLAEIESIVEKTGVKPVFLLDDVAAELDKNSRAAILSKLETSAIQSFITTTEPEMFELSKTALFHVEHGCLVDTDTLCI